MVQLCALDNFQEKQTIEDFINSRKVSEWLDTRTIKRTTGESENVITYLFRVASYDPYRSGVLVINLKESLLYNSVVNINRQKHGNTAILGSDNRVLS